MNKILDINTNPPALRWLRIVRETPAFFVFQSNISLRVLPILHDSVCVCMCLYIFWVHFCTWRMAHLLWTCTSKVSLEALEAEVQRLQRLEHLGENVETGRLVKALGDSVIGFGWEYWKTPHQVEHYDWRFILEWTLATWEEVGLGHDCYRPSYAFQIKSIPCSLRCPNLLLGHSKSFVPQNSSLHGSCDIGVSSSSSSSSSSPSCYYHHHKNNIQHIHQNHHHHHGCCCCCRRRHRCRRHAHYHHEQKQQQSPRQQRGHQQRCLHDSNNIMHGRSVPGYIQHIVYDCKSPKMSKRHSWGLQQCPVSLMWPHLQCKKKQSQRGHDTGG